METNQEQQGRTPANQQQRQDGGEGGNTNKAANKADQPNIGDEPIEDPAANSEIGAEIYDLGMGGPDASSSGLRSTDDDDTRSEED
jgi:hypothetical protein